MQLCVIRMSYTGSSVEDGSCVSARKFIHALASENIMKARMPLLGLHPCDLFETRISQMLSANVTSE